MTKSLFGISVIIPFYKGNNYLKKTVISLLKSLNYTDVSYEIIIINDSPNEEVDNEVAKFSKVCIYKNNTNKGIAYSRNKGKKISKYNYVYFIDQDDIVGEIFFNKAMKYMYQDIDAIIFNYVVMKSNNTKVIYNFLFSYHIKKITAKSLIKYGSMFRTTGQVILKKEILNDFIETKTMGSDDAYMFIDLFYKKEQLKIKYIEDSLFYYRIHSDNYTKKTNFKKSSLECFEKYEMKNKDISKYKIFLLRRYSGDLWLNFYGKCIRKIMTL